VKERPFPGPSITPSQKKVLTALVDLCPQDGSDARARQVADAAQIRLGSVVVVLRSLKDRRLALLHEDCDDHWAPTMSGRARIRHIRALEREAEKPGDPPPESA
jgi:predicted transcriptional regulator